ncbi:response regulator [Aestuariivirga litoralis]|uniref:response regulator n=1 Tax=Aestuariivirga litoralis TaxID=2650924 RepID=UPI0018C55211|nr:response regulator [Aestuariivirga litoralis]MBG1230967.1 response regulator [Aestuariivirga litoralis]
MVDLPHVMVVDDDARLRALLKDFLVGEGYRVTTAASASAARTMMQGLDFDALILDVMMPGETGLSFLKRLREDKGEIPVLMLSALSGAQDRIAGLSTGSDDYLAKPFEPEELLLRLQKLLRRAKRGASEAAEAAFGDYVFNRQMGELKKQNEIIKLTSGERDILRLLIEANGEAVSRDTLAGGQSAEATRKVDVQINRLRQKIEDEPSAPRFLQTIRGRGYALVTGR